MNFYFAFKGKNVLLTGHTGFKGAWLSLWLSSLGARVVGISLEQEKHSFFSLLSLEKQMDSHIVDIRDMASLETIFQEKKFDFVFHLAAQAFVSEGYKNPYFTFSTNTYGTLNILECIRKYSVPFSIIITTDKVYKNNHQIWGYRENDPLVSSGDPYSSSKATADIVAQSYIKSVFNLKKQGVAVARAGNVIGGGDFGIDRIIPDFMRSIKAGIPLSVRNPDATRPWCHVLEPLSGYLTLAAKLTKDSQKFSDVFNFGPNINEGHSVKTLIEETIKIFGAGAFEIMESQSIGYEAHLLSIDITKARSVLSWRPKLSFKETLEFTMDWYKRYASEDVYKLSLEQIHKYSEHL